MRRYIVIKTSFEAIHRWENCPFEEVAYLRKPHRHVFHVVVKWEVFHNDRDKEFIMMKHLVDKYIKHIFHMQDLGNTSCEMICEHLKNQFSSASFISVFEDNENGVEVYYDEI